MDDDVNFRERHPLVRYTVISLVVLIIAGFVTAIVIANNQSNSNSSNPSKPTSSAQVKKTPTSAAKSKPSPNQSAASSSGGTSSQSVQPLSNTGPGSVAILFITTTLTAGVAHYAYRRLRKI